MTKLRWGEVYGGGWEMWDYRKLETPCAKCKLATVAVIVHLSRLDLPIVDGARGQEVTTNGEGWWGGHSGVLQRLPLSRLDQNTDPNRRPTVAMTLQSP